MRAPTALTFALAFASFACSSSGAGGGAGEAMVTGTLTLPSPAAGKPWTVKLFTEVGNPAATPVAETAGTTGATTQQDYGIADVPAGTYFLLGFVDVDGSGGTASTPGDFAGWYGHSGDGNPPAAANAVVPGSGTVRFDVMLVAR